MDDSRTVNLPISVSIRDWWYGALSPFSCPVALAVQRALQDAFGTGPTLSVLVGHRGILVTFRDFIVLAAQPTDGATHKWITDFDNGRRWYTFFNRPRFILKCKSPYDAADQDSCHSV